MQVDDAAPWPDEPDAGEKPIQERANILIVDDLPEKLLVFQTVLEDLGQNLILVRSGTDALREVLLREFAVILLDVNMPGIDGFETAALIRRHRRSAHTPIIFITSYADEMQTARGYSIGAVDYILSPVVPEVLRSKVNVFVSLYLMQRQMKRQADARATLMAAQAARRVAEENDRRSAFLAHASRLLSSSLEAPVALEHLVQLLVPPIAPLAVAMLADSDLGSGEIVAATAAPHGAWITRGPDVKIDDATRQAMQRALRENRRVELASAAAVPLAFGDRVLGALFVAFQGASTANDGAEAGLLDEVAARAATGLENARLYRILQREILERQAAQEELQQTNQRKDEFLAMMSHELRNPLAPIHTAVEVIRRVAAPNAKATWALDIATRQLRQMTRLIEELLDVARISQGKIVLKREALDLNAVIAQSVETVQPSIDARHQSLSVAVAEHPVRMQGDVARLTQVIANLLHNASKYSPEGSRVWLVCSVETGGVVVSVRDEGIGIDADLLPRIFDLFAQGKRGLDRAQGGLGIGLTLAKRLTDMHGGRIEAFSEGRDRGSEFKVHLPCMVLVPEIEPAALIEHVPLAAISLRILVVDDNVDAAAGTAAMLELEGHHVRTAVDGAQALIAATEHRPDVVVLDIGLPMLDGYEVARRMRKAPETRNALLIALTGYGQKEDRQAALEAGFDRHFVKPADPHALLASIRAWNRERDRGGDVASEAA